MLGPSNCVLGLSSYFIGNSLFQRTHKCAWACVKSICCFFFQILTKIWMCRQILVKITNAKFYGNPSGGSCSVTFRQTEMTRLVFVLCNCFAKAPENSPWENDSCSYYRIFPSFMESALHYGAHYWPSLFHVLSQTSPFHLFPSCYITTQFNNILSSTSVSSKPYFLWIFNKIVT
jgi:hypothetical protein